MFEVMNIFCMIFWTWIFFISSQAKTFFILAAAVIRFSLKAICVLMSPISSGHSIVGPEYSRWLCSLPDMWEIRWSMLLTGTQLPENEVRHSLTWSEMGGDHAWLQDSGVKPYCQVITPSSRQTVLIVCGGPT